MVKIFGHYISNRSLLLAFIELIAVICTFYAAKFLTLNFVFGEFRQIDGEFTILTVLCATTLLVAGSLGLNNKAVYSDKRRFTSTLFATAVVIYFLIALFISISELSLESEIDLQLYYAIALLAIVFFVVFVFISRSALYSTQSLGGEKLNVLVVGIDARALKLEMFKSTARSPYEIIGFVPIDSSREDQITDSQTLALGQTLIPSDVLGDKDTFMSFVAEKDIDEIVVASRERRGLPLAGLLEARFSGIAVTDFSGFIEHHTGQLDIENLDPSWLIFSQGFKSNWFRHLVKRGFDILVSSTLLIVTLPITAIAALAIKIDSPGELFYHQDRVGLDGKHIRIYKFRSMRSDAEKDGVARWAQPGDSRVTRVGRILRKTRIDEIPQTYNVLIGDMSLVGPRPERPVFVEELATKLPYYKDRHRVKPGITGWAQINYSYGASDEDAKAKLAYDLYYLKNWDLFLDVLILFQTVRVVFWGEGAR